MLTAYQVIQGLRNRYPVISSLKTKAEHGKPEADSASQSQSTSKSNSALVTTKVGETLSNCFLKSFVLLNMEFWIHTYSQVAIIKLFDFLFQKKSIFQRILDSKEENLDLTERTISTDIHSSVSHEKVGWCYKFFNARFIQTITGILISLTMII